MNFCVRGQPGLPSEFQDSQGSTEKPYHEKKKKTKTKNKQKQTNKPKKNLQMGPHKTTKLL